MAVRDGIIVRNPAEDRVRRRSTSEPDRDSVKPWDLALPDVATPDHLVERVVEFGGYQCWGDMMIILATTALRISEVSGFARRRHRPTRSTPLDDGGPVLLVHQPDPVAGPTVCWRVARMTSL